jgi:hypothetical protein
MITAASRPAPELFHVSEVLEVATSILQRHQNEHLGKKTLIMQGFLEMSQRYPERDYRATIDRALAELTDAVHLHLNAELHTVTTLFARLGETTSACF